MKFCRICKSKDLIEIINYKNHAFAGSLLKKKQFNNEKKYHLKLNICNKCKHIQINNLVDPNKLFKNYLWETGISSSNILLIEDLIKDIKKNSINKKIKKC